MDVDLEPPPSPQFQDQTDPHLEMQELHLHQGGVSDTGLPVQSIQEGVDRRGNPIVIIEELDTPATRRERTRRAKAERARLAAEVGSYTTNASEPPSPREHEHAASPTPDGSTLHLGQEESDLSSLSGDSDEASRNEGVQASISTGRGRGRGRAPAQGKVSRPRSPGLGNISLPSGERLESGTLGIFFTTPLFRGLFLKELLQFGQSTSRTRGGVQSYMMMTFRISRGTSYNKPMTKATIL